MPPGPLWPDGVMRVRLGVEDNGYPATTGFWLLWSPTAPRDATSSEAIVTSFQTNLLPYFLGVMHSGATVRTCRLIVQGGTPWTYTDILAPNVGAGGGGVTLARSVGVYLQGASGGRGSGTRVKVPGIRAEVVDPPGKLNTFGVQQLQFLADALSGWPAQLDTLGVGTVQLITLRTRDAGATLNPAQPDLTLEVRPSLVLEIDARRAKSFQRLSAT